MPPSSGRKKFNIFFDFEDRGRRLLLDVDVMSHKT
jgi:hypothetical protein